MKKVNVGFVLVFVLTHQQQHGGVTRLVQDCLAQVDDGQGKVLQLLLQEQQGETVSAQLTLAARRPEHKRRLDRMRLRRNRTQASPVCHSPAAGPPCP